MKYVISILAAAVFVTGCASNPPASPSPPPPPVKPTAGPLNTDGPAVESVDVYVDSLGAFTSGGLIINDAELPIFVHEIAGGRRVILRPMKNVFPSVFVSARDKLKAAGVTEIILESH